MHDRLLEATLGPGEYVYPGDWNREQDRGDHRQPYGQREIQLANLQVRGLRRRIRWHGIAAQESERLGEAARVRERIPQEGSDRDEYAVINDDFRERLGYRRTSRASR